MLIKITKLVAQHMLYDSNPLCCLGRNLFKMLRTVCQKICIVGRGDNRAVTELSFAHVTTKTLANSGVFGFFRKKCWRKKLSPLIQITF